MKIKFLPQNIECEIAEDQTILEAAIKNGVNIDGNCAGKGICGKCKVKIISADAVVSAGMHTHYQLSEAELKGSRLREHFKVRCGYRSAGDRYNSIQKEKTDSSAGRLCC